MEAKTLLKLSSDFGNVLFTNPEVQILKRISFSFEDEQWKEGRFI